MTPPAFFLRAKHWQIFVVTFGLFLAGQFLAPYGWAFFLATGIGLMIWFLLWVWSLGEFLSSQVRQDFRPSIGRFRISLLLLGPSALMVYVVVSNDFGGAFFWFLPTVLTMYCTVYPIYFVAKSLKLAELQTGVVLSDYFGTFLLLYFHLVGVWLVQPRVNRLYARAYGT